MRLALAALGQTQNEPERPTRFDPLDDLDGKEVGLELAHEWTRSLAYGSIFGPWTGSVLNGANLMDGVCPLD